MTTEAINLLTDEECEIIQKLSEKPELTLDGAGFSYRYFGIDREPNIKDSKIIESILIKWCPTLVSFINFTKSNPIRIRVQTQWSPSFQGVHYLPLPTNEEETS